MKKYELMYILRPSLDDEARKAFQDRYHAYLTNNGATITSVNEWGLRELAYEIDDETKGYYVVCKIVADEASLYEFRRHANISKTLLRYIIVVDQD